MKELQCQKETFVSLVSRMGVFFIKERQRHLSKLAAFDTGGQSHTETQTFRYSE